jgi:hypothetical protein
MTLHMARPNRPCLRPLWAARADSDEDQKRCRIPDAPFGSTVPAIPPESHGAGGGRRDRGRNGGSVEVTGFEPVAPTLRT